MVNLPLVVLALASCSTSTYKTDHLNSFFAAFKDMAEEEDMVVTGPFWRRHMCMGPGNAWPHHFCGFALLGAWLEWRIGACGALWGAALPAGLHRAL